MIDYDYNEKGVELIEEALNIFANGEAIHDSFSRHTHLLGFQGMKRWHRMQSKEDRERRVYLQHYVIDMFNKNIEPSWNYEMPKSNDIKEHLENYLKWENNVYVRLGLIGNKLIDITLTQESKIITECLKDVAKEIERVRRWIKDIEIIGMDMSYLKLIDRDLHEKLKEIEK